MNVMSPRLLPLWALVLLPLVALAWVLRGPFLLERRVEMDVSARRAGDNWSLEWLDRHGNAINGRWLVLPATGGVVAARLDSPVSHKRFDTLLLRWRGMPGVEVDTPANVALVDRVLWWSTRTPLARREGPPPGVTAKDGVYTSSGPDGGIAWAMPVFTMAMVADVLVLYVLALGGLLVVWTAYHLKDGRPWYTPGRAAVALVLGVHAWFVVQAPLLYCPDSPDYLVNTKRLVEQGTWHHFNTLRLPGYSVFTAPMVAGLHRFNFAIGAAQGVLAVLTAWMAGRVVRAFLPGGAWAALAVVLVGLDPVLITYARLAMPECLTAFFCVLVSWVAVQGRFWTGRPLPGVAAAAVGVGLLLAAACYVRGNMMLVAGLIPLAIGLWCVQQRQYRRALVVVVLAWLTVGGAITPWLFHMHRRYGRVAFVLATGYGRCVNLADTDREDLNQTAAYGRERWETLAENRASGKLDGHNVMSEVGLQEGTALSEKVRGWELWTARDHAGGVIADETVARHPARRWEHSLRALCMQLGLWPLQPIWEDNKKWSGPLRGPEPPGLNHRLRPENYKHHKIEFTRDLYERGVESTEPWSRSDQAKAFQHLWSVAAGLRPLWAALVLLGTLCAVSRRQWVLVMLGAMVLAHAGVLAFHVLTGIDRYQVPMYPVMSVMAVYALACLAGAAPMAGAGDGGGPGPQRSRTRPAP